MWMYITNPKWIKLDELRKIHWSKNEELKNKILKSKDFKSLEEEWFEVKDWLEKIFSWELKIIMFDWGSRIAILENKMPQTSIKVKNILN